MRSQYRREPFSPRVHIPVEMLITLDEALDHLPGLNKPEALALLESTMRRFSDGQRFTTLAHVRVSLSEMKQLFIRDDDRIAHVSPRGTRTLVFLYNSLELPMLEGASTGVITTALSTYADKQTELESEVRSQMGDGFDDTTHGADIE
jgi:hypothetical protein